MAPGDADVTQVSKERETGVCLCSAEGAPRLWYVAPKTGEHSCPISHARTLHGETEGHFVLSPPAR